VTNSTSAIVRSLIQDPIGNYPAATVACFDPTTGDLPRRSLDHEQTKRFLRFLSLPWGEKRSTSINADAFLIGASTGQAHLRTPAELEEWFRVAADSQSTPLSYQVKHPMLTALLRPEDGGENERLLDLLAQLGYAVVFARPGNNLGAHPSDDQIVANMRPIVAGAAKRGLAVGLYSISDVSGCPMSPDVAAELVAGEGGENIVAIKVTEANYENSTLRFLDDPRLAHLKIVQGWDPHLSRALQDGPRHDITRRQRCGFTSGAMSFALLPYLEIVRASRAGEWETVAAVQEVVTAVFASMQDDPGKFADLQRAKVIMGLGQPITCAATEEQIERVFQALDALPKTEETFMLVKSLNLMNDGPYYTRLNAIANRAQNPD
jgi:hypothetical protein